MSIRSIAVAAASAAVLTITAAPSTAGTCKTYGFKITARHNVTCSEAKKVTAKAAGGKKLPAGWSCTKGSGLIPEGKCKKGNKSFKYGM